MTTKSILASETERLNAQCYLLWKSGFKWKGVNWWFVLYQPHPGDRIVDFLYFHETRLGIYNDRGRVHIMTIEGEWLKALGPKWAKRPTRKEVRGKK